MGLVEGISRAYALGDIEGERGSLSLYHEALLLMMSAGVATLLPYFFSFGISGFQGYGRLDG